MSTSRRFNTVGLVGRVGNPNVVDSVVAVARFLAGTGVELVLETDTVPMLPAGDHEHVDRRELGARCDLIVVVGGDGSMLGVARDLADSPALVVGVNRGGLGFLADVSPDQIEQKIGAVLAGEYTADERTLLEAQIIRSGEFTDSCAALNDVVVNAGAASRMMDFKLFVNGDFVYDQRSDGLIVSTPTGSTAYALSAGGPIMHPSLDANVVVPMFPHTLTSRPLVVPGDAEIRVVMGTAAAAPHVYCDSQVDYALQPGDEVVIVKHPRTLHLAYPVDHSFYQSCRSKLDWASRLGNG